MIFKKRYIITLIINFFILYSDNLKGDSMHLRSPSFNNNETIPKKYTCDGENISPALEWGNTPEKTKSFVLMCDDPDAPSGNFVHWILFNIPASVNRLNEHFSSRSIVGVAVGKNSFGTTSYGGPCPPRGHGVHHYHFTLYALDSLLSLKGGATKEEVEHSMKNHVLEKSVLIGLYSR